MNSQVIKQVLNDVFKLNSFRGDQEAIILRILDGGSCLVIMPTGMGKSLCYQLPSKILGGITLVISPLIALMKDQVDQALMLGLRATFINSSLDREEREKRYKKLAQKSYELVYVTPERFRKSEFLQALAANKVSLLAIDEAHCISEWGHDFRPDYTKIKKFRQDLGNPPTIALTATATPEVQKDIIDQLGLTPDNCRAYINDIARPNLYIKVEDLYSTESKLKVFHEWRNKNNGAGIVYFSLVSSLEYWSEELNKTKIPHFIYHGQLSAKERRGYQNSFLKSDEDLILATPAFGLGINKPNIRGVVHAELPGSIEAYYQEIGRAGRDGRVANTCLLYDQEDISIQMDFIKWTNPGPEFISRTFQLISNNPDKVKAQGLNYLREELNFYNRRDFRVETAVNLLEHWGFVEYEQNSRSIKAIEQPTGELMNKDLFEKRLRGQNQKLLQMVQLAKTEDCRKKVIYSYFGVEGSDCGNCDNCRNSG